MTAKANKGHFPKGRSGNPKGRPAKPLFEPDPNLPSSRRQEIMDVANHQVQLTIDGKRQSMSLYKANAYRLGMAGVTDRVASMRFIELITRVAEIDFAQRIGVAQINQAIEQLLEENDTLRRKYGPRNSGVIADSKLLKEINRRRFDSRRLDSQVEPFMLPGPGDPDYFIDSDLNDDGADQNDGDPGAAS